MPSNLSPDPAKRFSSLPLFVGRLGGVCLTSTLLGQIAFLATENRWCFRFAAVSLIVGVLAFLPKVGWSRRVYVAIGGALMAAALAQGAHGREALASGLSRSVFIAAFFVALLAISSVAARAQKLIAAGQFLAAQPPGWRYLALTICGHLYGLIMMYGGISLLGRLVADRDPSERQPGDLRRMLLAIQRGFVSILPWSPLSVPIAVTLTIVPGATWAGAVGYCVFSAIILIGVGWLLDTLNKQNLPHPRRAPIPAGNGWLRNLAPLTLLLMSILVAVIFVSWSGALEITAAVTVVLPMIALVWSLAMSPGAAIGHAIPAEFALREVPGAAGELTLVVMAPMIGSLGATLMQPLLAGMTPFLAALPPTALLLTILWLFPLTGQLGMHPLLCLSFFAPLLPGSALTDMNPSVIVTAITAGWALSGATSPFTASVLIIARHGGVTPLEAGLFWNGKFTLLAGALLSVWVALLQRVA